jgi:mRNA interferase MazF
MTAFKRGDVVLVEFVFSEGTKKKRRPAVVLSSDEYHKGRKEVILAAITSNVQRVLVGDTKIENWQEAGLKFPSMAAGVVQTMKSDMVEKKLGTLTDEDFQNVRGNLQRVMGVYSEPRDA